VYLSRLIQFEGVVAWVCWLDMRTAVTCGLLRTAGRGKGEPEQVVDDCDVRCLEQPEICMVIHPLT
jgi:hypothetical protein